MKGETVGTIVCAYRCGEHPEHIFQETVIQGGLADKMMGTGCSVCIQNNERPPGWARCVSIEASVPESEVRAKLSHEQAEAVMSAAARGEAATVWRYLSEGGTAGMFFGPFALPVALGWTSVRMLGHGLALTFSSS